MARELNSLRWSGAPGFYEAYYLTLTDRGSGIGAWIRYTLLAPGTGEPATCSLWFLAMDPAADGHRVIGRTATFPAARLRASDGPFSLELADASLTNRGMAGGIEDVAWELRWEPAGPGREPVHPLLRRARISRTVLTLPHPDLAVEGTLSLPGGRTVELAGARGGQAHQWGTRHAARWAWLHASDLEGLDGAPRPGAWVDGVSVFVPRLGRELGPTTPVVGSVGGARFDSVSPARVARNRSRFALTGWSFDARDGDRRLVAELDADRDQLAGVTCHDPDGTPAYCYNSETATLRLQLWERRGPRESPWELADTLLAPARAHFEYAQRSPVPGVELLGR